MLIYYIESACCVCLIIPSRFLELWDYYLIGTDFKDWIIYRTMPLSRESFSWEQTFKLLMSYMERACGKGRRF